MPTSAKIQYTVRGVPKETDRALRRKARQRGLSLNQLLVEELVTASGGTGARKYRDASDLKGIWCEDEEMERILAEQRQIDADLWR